MITKSLTILNKLGLHARAAAKLVSLCNEFKSEIILVKDDKYEIIRERVEVKDLIKQEKIATWL